MTVRDAEIVVIDYRAGNLASVIKAFDYLNAKTVVTANPGLVKRAAKVVLPGVGHFAATQILSDGGVTEAVRESVARGALFLGICVGMQWLFDGSTEAPRVNGAGFFPGSCERFQTEKKVPHVGWNSVSVRSGSRLMRGVESGSHVYFTHSYRAALSEDTVAVTEYGGPFTAAIESGNVMGVQFHPEKSGEAGLRMLKNFVEL